MQGYCNLFKSINVINHINGCKDKNHIIISINIDKCFDKIQNAFMVKVLEKIEPEGICPNTIKTVHNKHTASVSLNGDMLVQECLLKLLGSDWRLVCV